MDRCTCSMETDSLQCDERQHSADGRSPSSSDHQISFKTSTFRLQRASVTQKAAVPGRSCLLGAQGSTPGLRVSPRIAATNFSLLDERSIGALPSTALDTEPGMSDIPGRGEGTRGVLGIDMYGLYGRQHEPGVVPFIAVGGAFALVRQRFVPCRCLMPASKRRT